MINEADIRNAALEEAARLIEANIIKDTSAGKVLSTRQDGNRDGLAYAAAIRALKSAPTPVPDPKPFVFADPAAQREWERQRKERGE